MNGRRRRRKQECRRQKCTDPIRSEENRHTDENPILNSIKQMGRRLSSSFRLLCNSESDFGSRHPCNTCSIYENVTTKTKHKSKYCAINGDNSHSHNLENGAIEGNEHRSSGTLAGCFASVRRLHSHEFRRSKEIKRREDQLPASGEPRVSFRSTRSLCASSGRRSADTVYPIRSHEMAFLPDFPLKATVNEASFEVVDVIARGAFGNVIKVRNKTTLQIYALKIMSKNQIIRDKAIQQVKDEANIARGVADHPFIVSTFHHWQSKRYLYLLSEFIPHGELLHLWARYRPLSENIVRIYIAEIGIVLDFLHTNGIIYRDLKMENILLDARGHIQLTDFGLSKPLSHGSRTTTICGTLQYIAPEVLTVSPYDHAVDWWSLGILMYALLVGSYPYKATTDHISMANRVLSSYIDIEGTDCSTDAKLLLYRLLDRNPTARLRDLQELAREPFLSDGIETLANKDVSVFRML
ncbi:hypothetical protein ACOME3_007733 [Neoechinorhynchus agilis]